MTPWEKSDHVETDTLMDYVDEKLDASGREAVSRHLDSCEGCRRNEVEMRRFSKVWTEWNLSTHAETVWKARADLCEGEEDREGAVSALERLLKLYRSRGEPETTEEVDVLLKLAGLEAEAESWRAAEKHYLEALESMDEADPRRTDALSALISLYLEREEFDLAEKRMDELEQIHVAASAAATPDAAATAGAPPPGEGRDLLAYLRSSLQEWIKRETRPFVRSALETLSKNLETGVSGAFRILADKGELVLEQTGELLNPKSHWRFGYVGPVTLGGDPSAEAAPRRQIRALWVEEGKSDRRSEVVAALKAEQRRIEVDMPLSDFAGPVLVYQHNRSTGAWDAVEYRPGEGSLGQDIPERSKELDVLLIRSDRLRLN